jgi:hypothetical protein
MRLGRTTYQTNEVIDLSAVRSDDRALPAGPLTLSVTGADGSKMTFVFPEGLFRPTEPPRGRPRISISTAGSCGQDATRST